MSGSSRRVELDPAYVLHTRAYRETSLIVELFSAHHGRIAVIARGARRPKSAFRGLLNPFQPLRVSWTAKGELGTLTHAEVSGAAAVLSDQYVLAGFYVNELMLKLMERADPHPDLFMHYSSLIGAMVERDALEPQLRLFELQLLREIGYELNFATDAITGQGVREDARYRFTVDGGVQAIDGPADSPDLHPGAHLQAMARFDFTDKDVQRTAKRILRDALNHYLGDRKLHTRRVAAAMKQ